MFKKLSPVLLALALLSVSILMPARVLAAPVAQDDPDIVETAIAAGDFTTLVAAVEAAGLVETLQGDGPFTVFAPTDAAFAALPEGTVDTLLEDPTGVLRDILLYHVTAGEILAVDVLNSIGSSVEMANGQSATISVNENRVLLASAGFVATDIRTSNGIIHVIDAVIVPPTTSTDAEDSGESADEAAATESAAAAPVDAAAEQAPADLSDIVETAIGAGSFSTLVTAVQAAGLVETLQGDGPFTVFAPTDEAFAALPAGTLDQLLADPSGLLTDILLYHVVPGKVMAADVIALNDQAVTTALGKDVLVKVAGGVVMINDATVTATDIEASNGVIHVIDTVLLPPVEESVESVPAAADGCAEEYYVQRGDTLSRIAARYGVNTLELARANGIHNPNLIYRGQRICINH